MRHPRVLGLALVIAAVLSGCGRSPDNQVAQALDDVNVIDESNLNDVMLTSADPAEAVAYFQRAAANDPDRVDLSRGLAKSLIRARRPVEAAAAWRAVAGHPEATPEDRVGLADALIRTGDWAGAKATLDAVPPTHETFERYRLEAMVADSQQEWQRADSFYQTAADLTTTPAGVFNNWGFSKLTRGEPEAAERLFTTALRSDPQLFTAKNNLVLARGAQRNYDLPVVPMTQTERAQLLHTMALSAIKQGDIRTGRGLLQQAIDTHPRYFEAAARSLAALEDASVQN